MQYEIYNSLVIAEDDEDAEGQITEIVVTEERNLFVVWEATKDTNPKLVTWFREYERTMAIEFAVDHARSMRLELTKSKTARG